ncbi:AAA family ATPase [Streptomyces sp. P9-A4]|uniref:AAA family ATPase n=1 Tax=Streptomyces sp. P9-A4 TaxID=3072285 RepID=UPI002FC6C8DC
MRLHSATFTNFRRFAGENSLIIDDPITALVGPNEAGKTSILDAILRGAARTKFDSSDFTRGIEQSDSTKPRVELKFVIESDDLKEIADIPHGNPPKWLIVKHGVDGRILTLNPMPWHDPAVIRKVTDLADFTLQNGGASKADAKDSGTSLAPQDPLTSMITQAMQSLDGMDDFKARAISDGRLRYIDNTLRHLGALTRNDPDAFFDKSDKTEKNQEPRPLRRLAEERYYLPVMENFGKELASLRNILASPPPAAIIGSRLVERIPKIVKFAEQDRNLPSSFDFSKEESTPRGLMNLLRLAKVDGDALREAVSHGDHLRMAELTDQANANLKEAFQVWRQESVWPILHISGSVLRILVRVANGSAYTDLHDRSDGLRKFIALVACIHSSRYLDKGDGAKDVIVVVDEAENHLHYDAQADLIDVFTRQRIAKQIIYSTHSAGCLPEDIGSGVRVIRPTPGSPHSTIKNWFWSDGAGFTPMLLSMGAASLAFASVRRVVLTEGPSDMLLLPTLLRQACELKSLGYQIAPGLSEISPRLTRELDLEAAKSCFLVDGDSGGTALQEKLSESGVPVDRIVFLGGEGSGTTLEDLVDESKYRECVNSLIGGDSGNWVPDSHELPVGRRHLALKEWCEGQNISVPGKRLIAQSLARNAREQQIISSEKVATLRDLHASLWGLLE